MTTGNDYTDTVLGNDIGVLRLPRKILFGPGQRRAVGQVAAEFGSRVLVCTDARLGASEELEQMRQDLAEAGLAVHVFAETEAEVPVAGIAACVETVRGLEIDAVIGFGGGSCLDMAKAVAVVLAHGGRPQDYYGEGRVPGPIIPVIAVPTTAGTGSEATPVAVLADPELALKVGISSAHLVPEVALVDPELTHSCPVALTAACGIDAVVHLVEAFTAVRRPVTARLTTERVFVGKSDLTDAVALAGLQLMGRYLVTAYQQPTNVEARHAVMRAALCGGVALGTAGTAAAHALQYPLGALTHTPHGFGTGCLLPYVMRFNFAARMREFAQIATALGVDGGGGAEVDRARAGVEAVDALVAGVGIPPTLEALGLRHDQLPLVAEQALLSKRLVENNPRPLDLSATTAIATAAFHGDLSFPAP